MFVIFVITITSEYLVIFDNNIIIDNVVSFIPSAFVLFIHHIDNVDLFIARAFVVSFIHIDNVDLFIARAFIPVHPIDSEALDVVGVLRAQQMAVLPESFADLSEYYY
jgi:hypothetical protein